MNDSRWVIFVAISRLVFARNLDITILELQNSICFPALLGNIMLFDSDSLCYFCDSIPCRKLDTLLAETASHTLQHNSNAYSTDLYVEGALFCADQRSNFGHLYPYISIIVAIDTRRKAQFKDKHYEYMI